MSEARVVVMKPGKDNVATALTAIAAGTEIMLTLGGETRRLQAREDIPFGHKVAIVDIPAGAPIIKYGQVMGTATAAIPTGAYAHVHNIESNRGRGDKHGPAQG